MFILCIYFLIFVSLDQFIFVLITHEISLDTRLYMLLSFFSYYPVIL